MSGVARRTTPVVAAALMLAVAIGVVTPGGVTAAPAQPASGRPGAIPLPEPVEPRQFEVVDQTTFVGPGTTFTVGLRLGDVGDDATISLMLHQPVANRIQFGATLAGSDLGPVVQQVGPLPVRDLPTEPAGTNAGDVVRLRLVVSDPAEPSTNSFTLDVGAPGVYPLVVTLDDPALDDPTGSTDDTDSVVTHVVRPPDPPAAGATPPVPLSVATLVRLDGAVAVSPSGEPGLTPVTASRLAGVVAALARTTVPATVHSTGAVLDALAAAEPTAPFTAALAGRLLRPTWVPVSVTDLLAAGQAGFLERQLAAGSASARTRTGDVGNASVWVLDAGVDPDALSALVERGVRSVVVPESLAEPLSTDRFNATLTQSFTVTDGTGEAVPALQTDLALTALLGSSDQPALAANRVLADLAVLALDFPDLRRTAVLDTGASVDPAALQLVLEGLAPGASGPSGTVALLEARTVESALASTAAVAGGLVRGWDADPASDLGAWPDRLAGTDADALSLLTTLSPSADVGSSEAGRIVAAVNQLVLTSGRAGIEETQRLRLLDEAGAAIDAAYAAIGIPAQGTVTLTADNSVVPLTLVNGLADPVRVRLRVLSDKLEFPDGNTLELTLAPGTNRQEVAVRTRATGSFPVELDLRSADGRTEVATGRLSVRSTAFSGFGLVLSLLAGGFLAVWWARHFRSARRSRQLIDAPTASPSDGTPSPGSPVPEGGQRG